MIKKTAIWLFENTFFRAYMILCRICLWPLLLAESIRPPFRQINERSIEFGFTLKWLARLCPGSVLDVGPGKSAWPNIIANCGFRVTAIDKISGYWTGGYFNRHFKVRHDDITNPRIDRQFDMVTCISVLEHIPDHEKALEGMFKLVKPGGHIILTIPFNEEQYLENIYKHPQAGYGSNYSFICQIYSREQIDLWLQSNSGSIIDQEYYEIFTGDFWTCGERVYPPRKVEHGQKCHLTCLLIKKNEIDN